MISFPPKMLVNVFGPMCGGKTTLVNQIMKESQGVYLVDFDIIKRQLSGYYWKNDRDFATGLTVQLLDNVADSGRPIVTLLPPPESQEAYDAYMYHAEQVGYQVCNLFLTAPRDTLINRYSERLRGLKEDGTSLKVKTMDEFIATLDKNYVIPNVISFDTNDLDPEAVFIEFEKTIG